MQMHLHYSTTYIAERAERCRICRRRPGTYRRTETYVPTSDRDVRSDVL